MALCGHPLLFFVLCLSICPRPVPGQLPASRQLPASPGQLPARRQPFPAPNTCVPGQATAISSRVGNSSAQTVGAQAFRTLDFRLFEHKIAIFVRFCPSEPPISGFSSTKSGFLCSEDWESGIGNPKIGIGNTESGLPANHRAHL